MAEDDIPDFDLDDALDWLYVEDDFPLVDELAESQIPDPGYAGTRYDLAMDEEDDFDVFDYWDDLNYGDDLYWDYDNTVGHKRKRVGNTAIKHPQKRPKLSLIDTGGDNVRFISRAARISMAWKQPPTAHELGSYALFPDWRERFAHDKGAVLNREMPTEMKRAAEAGQSAPSPQKTLIERTAASAEGMDEDIEEEAEDDNLEEDDLQAQLASLDPETLKSILRQKLGDAGLEGMDEDAFMQTIAKMLSSEGGADDAADDLADSLLDKAATGDDTALSGWLSQQGVTLDAAENEEIAENATATPNLPNGIGGSVLRDVIQSSPSDSVIGTVKANGAATTELALHPASPQGQKTHKRPAPPSELDDAQTKKKKRVAFAVPTSPVPEREELREEHGAAREPEDPTISQKVTQASDTKAANGKAVKNNQSKLLSELATDANLPGATTANGQTSAATRQTRKRKGPSGDDETENGMPKKQAKKISAPADAVGKRSRTTRAAAKAGR